MIRFGILDMNSECVLEMVIEIQQGYNLNYLRLQYWNVFAISLYFNTQKLHSNHNIKVTFPGYVLPQTEALWCVYDVKDTGTGTALSGAFPHSAHSDNQIKHSMENRRVPR